MINRCQDDMMYITIMIHNFYAKYPNKAHNMNNSMNSLLCQYDVIHITLVIHK